MSNLDSCLSPKDEPLKKKKTFAYFKNKKFIECKKFKKKLIKNLKKFKKHLHISNKNLNFFKNLIFYLKNLII